MSLEAYGKTFLRRIGADPAVLKTIDRYMDFEGYSEQAMKFGGLAR